MFIRWRTHSDLPPLSCRRQIQSLIAADSPRLLIDFSGIDFVTSNVPGVPIPVFFGGARMEAQFAFGPMSGAATNITLLSYLDEVQIAVNTDPAAIPDSEIFLSCLLEGIDEVRKVG